MGMPMVYYDGGEMESGEIEDAEPAFLNTPRRSIPKLDCKCIYRMMCLGL